MTTSGVVTFSPVRDVVIKSALRLVGAYAPPALPRSDQITDANIALNMMLKSWQVQGALWVKEFVTVPMVASTAVYSLPDGVNTTYRPSRVFNASRRNSTGSDVQLEQLSREDYQLISNKTSLGAPNSYYFDPQLSTAKLYVWPVPVNATESLILDVDRPLQAMVDVADTYDFPDEWLEIIKYGLAVRVAPEYAVPLNERRLLEADFSNLASNIIAYNMDHTSTILGVNTHG